MAVAVSLSVAVAVQEAERVVVAVREEVAVAVREVVQEAVMEVVATWKALAHPRTALGCMKERSDKPNTIRQTGVQPSRLRVPMWHALSATPLRTQWQCGKRTVWPCGTRWG